jgi:GntR family transcriptional regulator
VSDVKFVFQNSEDILQFIYLPIVPSRSQEKVEAKTASTITAKRLGITTIDPVLARERYVYDSENQPVEYTLSSYNAYKYSFNIEIHHE